MHVLVSVIFLHFIDIPDFIAKISVKSASHLLQEASSLHMHSSLREANGNGDRPKVKSSAASFCRLSSSLPFTYIYKMITIIFLINIYLIILFSN